MKTNQNAAIRILCIAKVIHSNSQYNIHFGIWPHVFVTITSYVLSGTLGRIFQNVSEVNPLFSDSPHDQITILCALR